MRIVKTKLFLFSELSESAKEKVIEEYLSTGFEYSWIEEGIESISAFLSEFGLSIESYSLSTWGNSDWKVSGYDNDNFRGRKLKEFNPDHMPTGYCVDCDIWQTFHETWKDTGDVKHAFESAVDAGFSAILKDMEYQESEEYLSEFFEANEYEFTESGKIA